MKKSIFVLTSLIVILLSACNNKKYEALKSENIQLQHQVDSLRQLATKLRIQVDMAAIIAEQQRRIADSSAVIAFQRQKLLIEQLQKTKNKK